MLHVSRQGQGDVATPSETFYNVHIFFDSVYLCILWFVFVQNYTWQNLPQMLRLQRDSSLSPKKRPEKLGFVAFYVLNVCPLRGMRGMFVGCCGMPTQISASYTLVTVQNSATHSHKHIVMHNICVCWCCFRGANTEFTWITVAQGVTFSVVGNTNT